MRQIINNRRVWSIAIILFIVAIFAGLFLYARDDTQIIRPEAYSEYEKATVTQILTDSCEQDPNSENAWRGDQTVLAEVTTGQYKGETLIVENYVGVHSDYEPVKVGQSVVLHISTEADGSHRATVYEYDREIWVYVIIGIFILVTIFVGGKTGAKSILGLALTVVVLLCVFLPLLAKGWAPIPTAFLLCSLIAIVCFVILDGCSKKILCACMGTIAGMALAMLFGILAQKLLHIDGYQAEYAEALKNENSISVHFKIRGLIVAGVIISSLGAVMDVAMSIASALHELKSVNPQMKMKQLWKSGMNIGRDMVGTMTNTLILAILGSSLLMILSIYSMGLPHNQFMSSSFLGIEVISSVASAVGVILAVPLTTFACSWIFGNQKE